MDDARRAGLLAYCRIDELAPGEDVILEGMYLDAVAYLTQAGVEEPAAGTPRAAQYDLLVNAMVLDSWDNRGSQSAGVNLTENPAFRRRLTQMKLTGPVSIPDTGAARWEG